MPDIAEFERQARRHLDPAIWGYLSRGEGQGRTLAANRARWQAIALRPRMLRGVADASLSTTVLGQNLALPIMVAPNGRATRFHPDGEAAVLRGVEAAGTVAVLASSVVPWLPDLATEVPGAMRWVQLYFTESKEEMGRRVDLAAAAGCRAIVLTIDLLAPLDRLALPPEPMAPWQKSVAPAPIPIRAGVSLADVKWLCARSSLPVVVKGILRAHDACRCVEAGASAIIVSNHGGNQLDTVIATADALPAIAEAVGSAAEIYVDGGLRDGASVLKALALGARAVLIGRPASYGLVVNGADGVAAVLARLGDELRRAMILCGAASVADLGPDLLG